MKFSRGGRLKHKQKLPKKGDVQYVKWLTRDIKMGWAESSPKGTLLMGWADDSLQLWQTISSGPDAQAKFLGFVTNNWDGGPGL